MTRIEWETPTVTTRDGLDRDGNLIRACLVAAPIAIAFWAAIGVIAWAVIA